MGGSLSHLDDLLIGQIAIFSSFTATFHNLTTEKLTGPIMSLSTEIPLWYGDNAMISCCVGSFCS